MTRVKASKQHDMIHTKWNVNHKTSKARSRERHSEIASPSCNSQSVFSSHAKEFSFSQFTICVVIEASVPPSPPIIALRVWIVVSTPSPPPTPIIVVVVIVQLVEEEEEPEGHEWAEVVVVAATARPPGAVVLVPVQAPNRVVAEASLGFVGRSSIGVNTPPFPAATIIVVVQ